MPEAEGSGKRFKREEFFDRLQVGWAISFPACRVSRATGWVPGQQIRERGIRWHHPGAEFLQGMGKKNRFPRMRGPRPREDGCDS